MRKPDSSILVIVLCACLIAFMAFGLVVAARTTLVTGANYDAVRELANTITKHFYFYDDEGQNEEKLIEGALRGMTSSLDDPYAHYYTAEEYDQLLQSDAGDYVGIGISVATPDETGSTVIDVYQGGPAAVAGVQKGDVITAVNGKSAAGLTMDELMALFSTDNAIPDEMTVLRDGETLAFTISRGEVHINRVVSELLDGNIGYIRITEFNGSVADDFWNAASAFQSEGITDYIIDLRDNPGGGLNEVLGVAYRLIPEGKRIATIKSKTEDAQLYDSKGAERLSNVNLAVLVNGGSASASELLTGALQDHQLATVVGTQTYGKGIVQSFYRLQTTGGWIKLTTDAYYTPNDVCIHGTGITPDVVVEQDPSVAELPIELIEHNKDKQLQAAIRVLTAYVKNNRF